MRSTLPSRFASVCALSRVGVLADGDVQLAVGAEVQPAAVVIRRAAQRVEVHQHLLAARRGDVAVGGEAADAVVRVGVVAV
jgi:hypothetical protein